MFSKLKTIYHTVKHLKFIQVYYQLKYRIVRPKPLSRYGGGYTSDAFHRLSFRKDVPVDPCWDGRMSFQFLNTELEFESEVNWTEQRHGKLWNYNLQYANYLHQADIANEVKAALMRSQYEWLDDGRLPLEPYPVSLRAMNMMRWISRSNGRNVELVHYVYAELNFLSKRLEHHLLGNHLLENAFALMMGGAFFGQLQWTAIGQGILEQELEEQVLLDGAHFELSPMYHQIILFRVLELLDWYAMWEGKDGGFEEYLRAKASDMLAWLEQVSFDNGDIPHFNDSSDGISYPTAWLTDYAERLGVVASDKSLGESGYRSVSTPNYELKIDFAQVGPSYQPGHAHADALSFVLYHNNKPLLVEQGTSTYQIGRRRSLERSTEAHNTVVVNGQNQSQVWGGFRVAKRAKTTILQDGTHGVYEAKHDGYKGYGAVHHRSFVIEDNRLSIQDVLSSDEEGIAYFHLHPSTLIEDVRHDEITLNDGVTMLLRDFDRLFFEDYHLAVGFNRYTLAKRIGISFRGQLTTIISFDVS